MTSPSRSTSDLLNQTADYIEEHGWVQGRATQKDSNHRLNVCTMTALNRVASRYPVHLMDTTGMMPPAVALMLHLNITSIIKWNDAPGQTQEEVVKALRSTAEAVKQ